MTLCYLGLGSNLRAPQRQLRQAIQFLHKLPSSTIIAISNFYLSGPSGVRAQPNYYNLVLAMHTALPLRRLFHYCQGIENKHKRLHKKRWGARTLDIDILLYGTFTINSHDLIIPHPRMLTRDFVIVPLLEISPTARLPGGEFIASYLADCHKHIF